MSLSTLIDEAQELADQARKLHQDHLEILAIITSLWLKNDFSSIRAVQEATKRLITLDEKMDELKRRIP